MRITKRPSLEGSPERTASSAPFGNVGGAGPHLRSPELMGIFMSSAMAALHAKTIAKAINGRGITTSFLMKVSFCSSGELSQLMFTCVLHLIAGLTIFSDANAQGN